MMTDHDKTLIINRLPEELDSDDCVELLKHFGASSVRYMGKKGRMTNTAIATFENAEIATQVLHQLHQLKLLGSRLVVQFSSQEYENYHPSDLEPIKPPKRKTLAEGNDQKETKSKEKDSEKKTEKERKKEVTDHINSFSQAWNFEYPFNANLQYMYPAPTTTILMNITNALASVPQFYVQVLHLMNKMHLPAPFGLMTCVPPVPDDIRPPLPPDQVAPPQPTEEAEYLSTEESEIESEDEKKTLAMSRKRPRKRGKKQSMQKKIKLQLQMEAQMQAIAGIMPRQNVVSETTPADIFEQTEHAAPKKIEFKLAPESIVGLRVDLPPVADTLEKRQTATVGTDVMSAENNPAAGSSGGEVNVTVGGFGKIEPATKPRPSADKDGEEFGKQEFVSDTELKKGRLSEKEMKELAVFKKYETGESSTRLYIKNLAKHVTEKDLHYVYGRYIDWDIESEKLTYHIQLMKTGRLKGQAFIALPSVEKAKAALVDSNGFMLNGKPMVVQFSRSGIAKAVESKD